MNKKLIYVLSFFLVLVVYLSFLRESKIEALGLFFHPIAWMIIFMVGKEAFENIFGNKNK